MGDSKGSCEKPIATILEIQRMSTEDGPGIRTTVFFKGCTLNCRWCHNPESISPRPQIHWLSNQCIGCKTCLGTCPEEALTFTADGIWIDRNRCTGCGLCADACPATALEQLGKSWKPDSLTAEVLKDRIYFEKSGGGVTLGGGEPTLQAPFAGELLKRLKRAGIHTALDTCGMCSTKALEELLPHTDLLLFDLKEIDPKKHREFTGASNQRILENLAHMHTWTQSHERPSQIWIRTPIIPGTTATDENIRGIGQFIAETLNGRVSRWELIAFNNLCKDKYIRLGVDWPYRNCELLSKLMMEKMAAVARNSGVDPAIVFWNGSTQLEGQR